MLIPSNDEFFCKMCVVVLTQSAWRLIPRRSRGFKETEDHVFLQSSHTQPVCCGSLFCALVQTFFVGLRLRPTCLFATSTFLVLVPKQSCGTAECLCTAPSPSGVPVHDAAAVPARLTCPPRCLVPVRRTPAPQDRLAMAEIDTSHRKTHHLDKKAGTRQMPRHEPTRSANNHQNTQRAADICPSQYTTTKMFDNQHFREFS